VAKRKGSRTPVQGTLFGPADVYGGAPPAPVPHPDPGPPPLLRWDERLAPPSPEELSALRAAHPGAMLLFRHVFGCAFHGDDAAETVRLLGLFPAARGADAWAGFPHGEFEEHVRKLLRAGKSVCVVERGEGLPQRFAVPVVTPVTALPPGKPAGRRKGEGADNA
jgi:hypothetical protein